MDRSDEDRILRFYKILSYVALIGPICYVAVYLLFITLWLGAAGVDSVDPTVGLSLMYLFGIAAKYFPLILSPAAIIAALIMKFRYDIEMIWPLKTAILFYAIVLYHFIENRLLF